MSNLTLIFYLLIGLVLLLQVVDVWTTNRILARRGRELNPLVRWLIRHLGRWWWISKAPVLALFFLEPSSFSLIVVGIIALVYAVVVLHNLRSIRGR